MDRLRRHWRMGLATMVVLRSRTQRITRALRVFAIAYVCGLAMLMLLERALIYPIPDAGLGDWNPAAIEHEDVWLKASDGTRLHGWYLPQANSRTAIVYFHGNGEDVSWCGPALSRWGRQLGSSALVMNYRGYGKSEGKPGEAALIEDGVLAANWLAKRSGLKPEQLVLWGRSIGGGVAAGVAQSIDPQAIIMECSFDSLAGVAATHVRWAPVRWLMSNQYRSADRLSGYKGQFLQWHGGLDAIVPLSSAERLFASVGSTAKRFVLTQDRGHNDESPPAFNDAVADLFDRLNDRLEFPETVTTRSTLPADRRATLPKRGG